MCAFCKRRYGFCKNGGTFSRRSFYGGIMPVLFLNGRKQACMLLIGVLSLDSNNFNKREISTTIVCAAVQAA